MKNTLRLFSNDTVQVAAHRGTSGANIPCNTIPAFDIALKGGASKVLMVRFSFSIQAKSHIS